MVAKNEKTLERVFDTAEAGVYLHLHQDDVCRLIHAGKLAAKLIVVRGKGKRPRYLITESGLRDFIDGLPDAGAPLEQRTRAATAPKRSSRWTVEEELKQATKYH